MLVTAVVLERAIGLPQLHAQTGDEAPTAVYDIVRSDLQMRFTLETYGLELDASTQTLTATAGATRTRLVFHIGTQHVDDEVPASGSYGSAPVQHRAAAPTRLAFDVTPPVPFDLDTLLDWQDMALALDGRAAKERASADQSNTGAPHGDVTVLEVVEGLQLSPIPTDGVVGLNHPQVRLSADPQRLGATSVTWQALVHGDGTVVPGPPTLRAIWAPGYVTGAVPSDPGDPFPVAVTALDRRRIVQATGDWSDPALDAYPAHEPIATGGPISLSPVGATASMQGAWTGGGALASWLTDTALGRTMRATTVTSGHLLPFGHPASITRTAVRTFVVDTDGHVVDGLVIQESLVIPPSTVTPAADLQPDEGRAWPLPTITLHPPEVVPQGRGAIPGPQALIDTERAFLLQRADGTADAGRAPHLTFEASDRAGSPGVAFSCPVVFVSADVGFEPDGETMYAIQGWMNSGSRDEAFTIDLGGQVVALADVPEPGKEGQVAKAVTSLRLTLDSPVPGTTADDLEAAGQVGAFPRMREATITDPVVESLGGTADPQVVVPHPDWLAHGYGSDNIGGSYLQMPDPLTLSYQGGGGSLTNPGLVVQEYNLDLGVSAPLDDLGDGWNPLENLSITSKLFGAVPLAWILPDSIPVDLGNLGEQVDIPGFTIELLGGVPPTSAVFTFCWEPPLKSLAIGGSLTFVTTDDLPANQGEAASSDFDYVLTEPTSASFCVTQTVAFDDGADGGARLEIAIRNVALQVPPVYPLVQLYLAEVALTVDAVEGETVNVDLVDIAFTGPLNFLDIIQDYLGGLLGDDPFNQGDDDTIVLASGLTIPGFALGVFSVSDFYAATRLELPRGDDGQTLIELDLGPISATVNGFGAGGAFYLLCGPHPDGILQLTASLFGVVEISVDVFIAKAWASVTFGAELDFFAYDEVNSRTGELDRVEEWIITIFVEISAGLSILGIISVEGLVRLSASYNVTTRIFSGSVTAAFAVDYLFGETSKSVTFTESFRVGEIPIGGGRRSADPQGQLRQGGAAPPERVTFADRFTEAQWLARCGKFA